MLGKQSLASSFLYYKKRFDKAYNAKDGALVFAKKETLQHNERNERNGVARWC